MKRILSGWLVLVFVFSLTACAAPKSPSELSEGKAGPKAVSALPGAWDFSHQLLLASAKKGENILLSPLSVEIALSMAANGAEEETLKQIEDLVCSGTSVTEWNGILANYLESRSSGMASSLSSANLVLAREDRVVLSEEFSRRMQDSFGAEVFRRPFDEEALNLVNDWVSRRTDGMIPFLLDQFDPETAILLINALLLEVCWKDPYGDSQISDGIFTSADGRRQDVKMMTSEEDLFFEWEGATGAALPFSDGYSLLVILPEKGIAPEDALASLSAGDLQKELREGGLPARVTVKIPQFSMEDSLELQTVLRNLGMDLAFDEARARFDSMGTSREGALHLDKVLHKSALELDAKGVRAAALTAAVMNDISYSPEKTESREVILDRPFAFYLLGTGDVPIFAGIVNEME